MLTRVDANGFRSLNNFSIVVKPGLNVLVGPNGGGKTNILSLFSFISALASDDLGAAINSSGGASKVFRKMGKTSYAKALEITAFGEMKYDRSLYLPPNYDRRLISAGFVSIKYVWSAVINAGLGYDEVYYSHQSLKVKSVTKSLFKDLSKDWDLERIATSKGPGHVAFEEFIHNREMAELLRQSSKDDESKSARVFIDDVEDEYTSSLPIFYSFGGSYLLRRLTRDLRSGSTFNFDPAVCKRPNDSAQSPSLGKNGDGLAATVYAIQKADNSPRGPLSYLPRRRFNKRVNKTLQEYFRLVNPAILGVSASNNPFDNRITVQISVDSDHSAVDFPLELANDGTVKWLAFTVALLTEGSGFSVEEPENFLHPDIQRHAVELVRAETDGAETLYVLLTTHSETLLNAARPEEIIVVSMQEGRTLSKRLDDPELIDEEIQRTGFGLGYYYISGALND